MAEQRLRWSVRTSSAAARSRRTAARASGGAPRHPPHSGPDGRASERRALLGEGLLPGRVPGAHAGHRRSRGGSEPAGAPRCTARGARGQRHSGGDPQHAEPRARDPAGSAALAASEPRFEGAVWRALSRAPHVAVVFEGGEGFARTCREIVLRLALSKLVWVDAAGGLRRADASRCSFVELDELRRLLRNRASLEHRAAGAAAGDRDRAERRGGLRESVDARGAGRRALHLRRLGHALHARALRGSSGAWGSTTTTPPPT